METRMSEIHDLAIAAANNTDRFPEGMAINDVNDSARELEAMLGRFVRDISGANVSTGTSTAYLLEPYRTIASYSSGVMVVWRANVACGVNPTLDVDGLGPKNLTDVSGNQLGDGDIPAGAIVVSYYNATRDSLECHGINPVLPASGGGSGDMLVSAYDAAGIAEQLVGLVATQTLTNKTLTSPIVNAPALSADSVDAITEIAAALKSGADATLVTGTAGTNGYVAKWNADGDLVDGNALSGAHATIITGTAGSSGALAAWNADGDVVAGPSFSGADATVLTGTAGTSGNLAQWDANGDLVDSLGKTGSDTNAVTGTAGTSGNLSEWNADGDLVDSLGKTGSDANAVTGTAGTSGNLAEWNADGDLVDSLGKTGADTNAVTGTAGTSGNIPQWNADGDLVDGAIALTDIVTAPTASTGNVTVTNGTEHVAVNTFIATYTLESGLTWCKITRSVDSTFDVTVTSIDAPTKTIDGNATFTIDTKTGPVIFIQDPSDTDNLISSQPNASAASGGVDATAEQGNFATNPGCRVSQENGTTSATTTAYFPVDELSISHSQDGTLTVAQVASVTPGGSTHRVRTTVTTADTSLTAGQYATLDKKIEGLAIADWLWGTASARDVLCRFLFNGPAGTYAATMRNAAGNRSYVREFTITGGDANDDTVQTVVFPGDTSGTWPTTAVHGATFIITLAAGSAYQTTADAWQGGNYFGTSSTSNGIGTITEIFEVSDFGIYLDPNSTGLAPEFVLPDYPVDLQMCQRYWIKLIGNLYSSYIASTGAYIHWTFPVSMRVAPTMTAVGCTGQAFDTPTIQDAKWYRITGLPGYAILGAGTTANSRM